MDRKGAKGTTLTSTTPRIERCGASPGRRVAAGLRRAGDPAGFTLLELTLVLLILGVILGVVVPRLRDTTRARLESEARKLAVTLRYLRQEAILNGRTYRLNYSLEEGRYWVTSADAEDELGAFLPETGMFAQPKTLKAPIGFSDLVLPDTFGMVQEGYGYTDFYPDGWVDLTLLHLDNGQESYTVFVESLTGHVSIAPGYHELPSL